MNMREQQVIKVQERGGIIDIGPDAPKSMQPCYRYRYKIQLVYTTADNEEHVGEARALTKPKLAQRLQQIRNQVDSHELFLQADDEGNEWYVWKAYIGPRR